MIHAIGRNGRTALILALWTFAVVGGCRTQSRVPDPLSEAMEQEPAPTAVSLTARAAFPYLFDPGAAPLRFAGVEGEDEVPVVVRVEPLEEGLVRVVEEWRREGGPEEERVSIFGIAPDGGVLLVSTVEPDRDEVNEFDPPLLVFPPVLEAGVPVESVSRLTVREVEDPKHISRRGEATFVVELVGEQPLVVETRSVPALVTRSRLRVVSGIAVLHRNSTRWINLEVGPVAEQRERTLRILGVPSERTSQALVRWDVAEE